MPWQGASLLTIWPGRCQESSYREFSAESKEVNYHYLQVEDEGRKLKIIMNRLDLTSGNAMWTQPDSVTIVSPEAKAAVQGK